MGEPMTDDHDRLINLVVRLEAQEVGMAELKRQVGTMHDQRTEEAINCPFWPGKGNNGVGNGLDPQPPGNPPINDGHGTSPGHPGNRGGWHHPFAGEHTHDRYDGGLDHRKLVDWDRKPSEFKPGHESRIPSCSSWVKPFVCDVERESPNKNIKITLSHAKDDATAPSKGRKH